MALEMALKIKAGVVWVNSTNRFDAACGFGGTRESGYGREGGFEGLFAYMKPSHEKALKESRPVTVPEHKETNVAAIDRTAKMYIGGKQARPDGNYNMPVISLPAFWSAKSAKATARTSETLLKRPQAWRQSGPERSITTAPRSCTTWPKTCHTALTNLPIVST